MWRDPYAYLAEFTGGLVVPANGQITVAVDVDREADFEIHRLSGLATSANLRVDLRDQDDRLLIGNVTPWTNVIGDGQRPYRFQGAARIIKRTNQIRPTLFDRSAAPNTARILFSGAQLFPSPPFEIPMFQWAEPYPLTITFGAEATDQFASVPANGTLEGSIRLPGDSWFDILSMTVSRAGVSTLQILTNGTREWFRRPVHTTLLGALDFVTLLSVPPAADAGFHPASQYPYEFTPSKLMQKNTTLTFRIADLSGALNAHRITMHAIRRYE